MQKILKNLASVCWSPSQSTSTLLTSRNIIHGFCGVDTPHPDTVHHVKQVHGITVVQAQDSATSNQVITRSEADGVWTNQSGISIAVKTADCLPVLFAACDRQKSQYKYVMAVHAGWRGLVAGIFPKAVQTLMTQNPNVDPSSIVACIGPAISREQFEVGPEVVEAVMQESFELDPTAKPLAISKGRQDRWHFDLATAAALQLMETGVQPNQIEVIQACTNSLPGIWHSYRREGKGCGSNWSWIESN